MSNNHLGVLADYDQSLARTMRPGQKHDCIYYHLICRNSVDEKTYAALESKQEVVTSILGGLR
jgi:SNF2 family DNA or RNA helicase